MRYLRFTIRNYRAITGPMVVDVDKKRLTPIIGINESGKTTILHALFAFDRYNDDLNDGRHLKDTSNLYKLSSPPATIAADVDIAREELFEALDDFATEDPTRKPLVTTIKKRRRLPDKLVLTRDLSTMCYNISPSICGSDELNHALTEEILTRLPYTLFFDDFRDKVDEQVEIEETMRESPSGWLAILERLFRATDKNLSIFDLAGMEQRQRKSVLAKVQRHLNTTLTTEWQNFRLDDRDALEISLDFVTTPGAGAGIRKYLKLEVVETDAGGDKHYFFISDRSKGFFWFFNFVMKLEFNPKVLNEDAKDTIYLLDEPGSYLHASAQSKLCGKLRSLSEHNRVLYCTHSHYLLNPEVIPLPSITVADKDANGSVGLVNIFHYRGGALDQRSAFQPVLDALHIKPFMLDVNHNCAVIVEGIYDYYALELFRNGRQVSVLPSVGADSVKFFISLMIAWQINFRALWDNDVKGRESLADATAHFGEEVAQNRFRILPKVPAHRQRILQDLFIGEDLVMLRRELSLPTDADFKKTIAAWFFSSRRNELLADMTQLTRDNFEGVYTALDIS
jgi:hypothetical protein